MNSILSTILLEGNPAGGGMSGIFMIVAMVVIFYFFMIRPQNKKQKEIKRQREAMKKDDKVVTAGGIHGRIREVRENTLKIEIAPNTSIIVDKASVYPAAVDAAPATPAKNRKENADKAVKEEVKETPAEDK